MRKIKLLKLNLNVSKENFVAVSNAIYSKTVSVSQYQRDTSPITTIFDASWNEDLPSEKVVIGSLRIDNVLYTEVETFAELYTTDKVYYYSFSEQRIFTNLVNYANPLISTEYVAGEVIGFLSEAQNVDINGFKFPINTKVGALNLEPRLLASGLDETIDDQSNGIFVFNEMTASLNNSDGKYDTLRRQILGNTAELLIADIASSKEEELSTGFTYKIAAEEEDFKSIQKGIVEDVRYTDPNNPEILAIDPRADWTQKIGVNLLTQEEFPTLPEKYIDNKKPFRIGKVNGCNCIPLSENEVAADLDYFITDTTYGDIQSISNVYFVGQLNIGGGKEEVNRYLEAAEYTVDFITGIITIHNCIKGDVYVYGYFTEYSELVEIVLFLLDTFAGLDYISGNFNIEEIETIRALNYQVHVNLDTKGEELFKVVEKLILDTQIDFLQLEGVYTMRRANEQREVTQAIDTFTIFDNPIPWDNSRIESIKTISVVYDYDYRTKDGLLYYDNTQEEDAVKSNKKAVDKDFTVSLSDASQVESIYTEYYNRFTQLVRVLILNSTIPFIAGLTDFVSLPIIRRSDGSEKEIFPNATYKVVRINKNENTAEVVYFADVAPEPVKVTGVQLTPDGFVQRTPWFDSGVGIAQLTADSDKQKTPADDQQQIPVVNGGERQLFIEEEE